ncbi:hypothetical protein [Nocardia sp. NPDC020380]|uniref:hypothetical protein n=1 Tax=Nocardia sp. NPDC020380 TaxID=3364309 RepID=UPI0037B197A5
MIYESTRSITSSSVQEWARRFSAREGGATWELSWRPEPLLTREQARDAMELTELCSTGAEPGARAADLAAELGITVQYVMAVLQRRRRERGTGS